MAPDREWSSRRGAVAALGAAALLALTAACAPIGPFGTATGTPTPTRALSTAGTPGQATVLGSGVPEPTPTTPFPPPATAPDPYWHLTPPPVVTRTPTAPTGTPTGVDCTGLAYDAVSVGAVAVPGAPGAARVSWTSRASSALQGWKVAVAPQAPVAGTQPPLRWVDVAAPAGCTVASTTVTGLTSGAYYEFWLHAQLQTREDVGPSLVMVGRTPPFLVP